MCSVYGKLGLAQTLVALRQPTEAERLVLAELEQVEEAGNAFVIESLRSFMARLALASDDPDGAYHWLAGVTLIRRGITGFDLEDPLLTRARVLVARAASEDLGERSPAVDREIEAAEARHVTASLVQGLALRALVERARGEISRAVSSIAQALEIAEPGRFTRAFVDLGPSLTGLLIDLAGRSGLPRGECGCSTRAGRSPIGGRPSRRSGTAPRRTLPRR